MPGDHAADSVGLQAGGLPAPVLPGLPDERRPRPQQPREALTRRSGVLSQVTDLQAQETSLQAEEEKLAAATQRLEAKVEAFRTRKETIKATYTAAEAQTKVGEALSGISDEWGDIGLAVQRAEDKTATLAARAGAIDELLASGALDDLSTPGDRIDAELARLRAELPAAGQPPKELE